MSHFTFNGVNDAFKWMVEKIHTGEIPTIVTASRVGEVMQIPEPVIMTYLNPLQRVLFNKARDCNPYFFLFESLWMLAGRNDIAPLDYYSSGYRATVDDGNGRANAAYGYRWRNHYRKVEDCGMNYQGDVTDQLSVIIDHLKRKPESRRAVLSIWNVEDDLLRMEKTKDNACNLAVTFQISDLDLSEDKQRLDMTVFNRSNDLTFGALGANVVHFSFLQEYMANCLGRKVGVYNQVSANLHCYTERWFPSEWLASADESEHYIPSFKHIPLVENREMFDSEVKEFVEVNSGPRKPNDQALDDFWSEPFLNYVAQPMCNAFHCHKLRDYSCALQWIAQVRADDWRIAGMNWLQKRKQNWEAKNAKG